MNTDETLRQKKEREKQQRQAEAEREYGKCAACQAVFQYGDKIVIVQNAGCGSSQGYLQLYEMDDGTRYHQQCYEKLVRPQ